jgi:hypothetical protein
MGDEPKIDVRDGGIVYLGQPFKWHNKGAAAIASDLLAVCTESEYQVPGANGGKDGSKDAVVNTTATVGQSYPYTVTDGITNTQPKLTVNSSMPIPKK